MIARIEKDFCHHEVFGVRSPVCLSQRSAIIPRSRRTTMTVEPAMKRGLYLYAPVSDRYAMV